MLDFPLVHLEAISRSFCDLADSLGRPLLPGERRAFRWLLAAWEHRRIQAQVKRLDSEDRELEIAELLAELRDFLIPDPVKQIHLQRAKPETVAELNAGNFSLHAEVFQGVSIRRMTRSEANERIGAIGKAASGIGVMASELALVCTKRKAKAKPAKSRVEKLVRLARLFERRAVEFTRGFDLVIPAEPSTAELEANMRLLNELMQRPEAKEK